MLFNSYLFVFAFLPIVILVWYGLNRLGRSRLAQMALVLMSLVFYGYGHPEYIALILVSVFGNYAISWGMEYFGAHK
ncbi:MAG: MBOAT family protein, partial [Clostridiales bacterium]|nr:MBOAT family protein [Clostridiales bacterium]MDY4112837.1 MBOAT family protein [Roseburia sp.]